MKNKATKQKSKRKGSVNAFGCDLTEHLQSSGQDVPQVLKTCAEFIEKHGIVDGIYRLSGITSNIQRLRQEFISKLNPDLTKEVYLQDIHCVGSLCKLYFRELPNPLLTYELYKKFTDAVSFKEEHEQLQRIKNVIKELPPPHYRTLEYLTKHLAHLATFSSQTNMHARNLALVWAPNLLRSKEIEVPTCNGDIAFLEVRVQQTVVEFILNHMDQIFNRAEASLPKEGSSLVREAKSATLPASRQYAPMKLMSLEEAQARSLDQNHPARRDLQQDNSLLDTSTAALYHTVIDLPDCKSKFSGKSKKWKSIFNLGRSVTDSKGKLSRNGSVFVRAQKLSEKAPIRPTKSMDSLCSLSTEDNDKESKFRRPSEGNGFFIPVFKSHTLGSGSIYDLSKEDHDFEPEVLLGATGGSPNKSREGMKSGTTPMQKALPEQLKVFKGDDLNNCQPTSPKNRRMLYSCSTSNCSSKSSFPGSLFPLESSPRHQHKALTISEPFAVSVPLRVSAVISSNSTPCRASSKDKAVFPPVQPRKCSSSKSSTYVPLGKEHQHAGPESSGEVVCTATETAEGHDAELGRCHGMMIFSKTQQLLLNTREEMNQPSGPLHHSSMQPISSTTSRNSETRETLAPTQCGSPHAAEFIKPPRLEDLLKEDYEPEDKSQHDKSEELWPLIHPDLKIIEPDIDIVQDESEADNLFFKNTSNYVQLKQDSHAKRRSSFPTYPVLSMEHSTLTAKILQAEPQTGNAHRSSLRDIPERLLSFDVNFNAGHKTNVKQGSENQDLTQPVGDSVTKLHLPPLGECNKREKELSLIQQTQPIPSKHREAVTGIVQQRQITKKRNSENVIDVSTEIKTLHDSIPEGHKETFGRLKQEVTIGARHTGEKKDLSVEFREGIGSFPKTIEDSPRSLELTEKDEEDTWGEGSGGLDLVEPWEDYSSAKQWVTSPLHSPKTLDFSPKSDKIHSFSMGENYFFNKPNITLLVKDKEDVEDRIHTDVSTVRSRRKSSLPCHLIKETDGLQSLASKNSEIYEETTKTPGKVKDTPEQKNNPSFHNFHKQTNQDTLSIKKSKENTLPKHPRPYSLNLDLGMQFVKETSVQQKLDFFFPDISSTQKETVIPPENKFSSSSLQLEMFLTDHRAPMRRNSAPVSVSSVRTSFMIKTCQAKAVPVIPPKIQYSHIPQPLQVKNSESYLGEEIEKVLENSQKVDLGTLPALPYIKCPKEEIENNKPISKTTMQTSTCNSADMCKAKLPPDQPILRRKRNSNGEASGDSSRFDRSTITHRHSFRTRPNRPQSLILFSPPFPIMDYPPLGDDGRLFLTPIKNTNETSKLDAFNEEVDENVRNPGAVTLRKKMTMPKSGQRLETSTSCFYQPQRESMVFESRGNRQID